MKVKELLVFLASRLEHLEDEVVIYDFDNDNRGYNIVDGFRAVGIAGEKPQKVDDYAKATDLDNKVKQAREKLDQISKDKNLSDHAKNIKSQLIQQEINTLGKPPRFIALYTEPQITPLKGGDNVFPSETDAEAMEDDEKELVND